MNKKTFAATLAALLLSMFAGVFVAGCHSDPHDTHIQTNVSAAR